MVSKELDADQFSEIIQNIKENYLSQTYMPKLLIGTGLSKTYGLPGMTELFEYLSHRFDECPDGIIKKTWNAKQDGIKKFGLEQGLADIVPEEQDLYDEIKVFTAELMLNEETRLLDDIYNKDTGFKKLLQYLKDTCSVNDRIIDIMTPNYDRIIELVCDNLNISVATGFDGQYICNFNQSFLKHPELKYNIKKNCIIRLFKPHGSINWLQRNGKTVLCNDNNRLKENAERIEIIIPGGLKYKAGMVNNSFRCMREDFNEILDGDQNYSLFIFGYGFNDEHFNTVILDHLTHNTLIISKNIRSNIIQESLKNNRLVLFFEQSGINYMVYKENVYKIDQNMWDINVFSSIIIG